LLVVKSSNPPSQRQISSKPATINLENWRV
jgi:hypothetical protein